MITRITPMLVPSSLAGINFEIGRGNCPYPIDSIVIHCTEGDAASVRDWFRNPKANDGEPSTVSAHYMVRRDGGIEQFIEEANRANHAGIVVNPTNPLVIDRYANGKWSPNGWSIGIEHEAETDREDLTKAQRDASYALLVDIIARYKIPVDRDHIIAHHEVRSTKTCPGIIDVDRIVDDLQSIIGATPIAPAPDPVPASDDYPLVVFSPHLNDYIAVARYVSQTEWYYVPFKAMQAKALRAGAPLSAFPLTRPTP